MSHLEIRAGAIHPETKVEREICRRLRRGGASERWRTLRSRLQPEGAGTVLLTCAPVVLPADAPVGSLCLFDTADRTVSADAARRLADLAALISEWPGLRSGAATDRAVAAGGGADEVIAAARATGKVAFGKTPSGLRTRPVAKVVQPEPLRSTPSHVGGPARATETMIPQGDVCDRVRGSSDVRDLCPLEARERQIDHMAQHDGLTGLMNRDRFHACLTERLDRLERDGVPFAMLYLDLDRLSVINETLGHRAGDAVLVGVADRLRAALREEDIVGRIGGDEFAILQIGAASQPASSAALAQRLIEALTGPTLVLGKPVEIELSIGVVVVPTDGRDSQVLMKRAALALSRAKADGRNTRRFYEPAMDAAAEARRNLEIDLRGALSRGEFEVYYQPLVDARTGRPTGAEALVRWRHQCKGLVSPAHFIALAEETGLIVPLGEWVLRRACRDAADWPVDMRIAVNISAVQFRQARFVEVVMHALAETGLAPERLELEITETVLMKSLPQVVEALHLLRRLGVRISLDDFGTGYSSLSYLRTFPFDKLKIDQSFVQDLADPATVSIMRAITALGHGLGMTITAEGVETEEQRAAVRDLGCTNLQGYLFGRPLAKTDFEREHLSGRA
ncbi:putative bifunctional diguanylate cyclase/phosphodiesterase [Methylobacterium sp. J-070]|uniref:putative bifunctional diguanylate cyclase/phosphodiesterase n=1 Tax=Methylobacterium sp. J-070 TaxID=2836650 RepID=UPI001FBA37B1|nr:bifunctional diguanylate cyclase/phosphodiesterase [Methylobacterium sp. J-070]MCJ2048868.1 bifunctional diguanylate cyclase/phosphodiesterase [Methylobacterium sp. J-070]